MPRDPGRRLDPIDIAFIDLGRRDGLIAIIAAIGSLWMLGALLVGFHGGSLA